MTLSYFKIDAFNYLNRRAVIPHYGTRKGTCTTADTPFPVLLTPILTLRHANKVPLGQWQGVSRLGCSLSLAFEPITGPAPLAIDGAQPNLIGNQLRQREQRLRLRGVQRAGLIINNA